MTKVRLIDANMLLKNINTQSKKGYLGESGVIAMIQNAQTVTFTPDCVLKEFGECSYAETGCSDCKVKQKIRKALGEDMISKKAITDQIASKCDTCPKPYPMFGCVGCYVPDLYKVIEGTVSLDDALNP